MEKKYCIVPQCFNSTIKTPDKLFFYVPEDPEMRKKWMTAVKRVDSIAPKTKAHCCEDHFDVENDMENYVKYKLVGGKLKLKKGVVPHRFDCQKQAVETPERFVVKKLKIAKLTTSSSECIASTSHDVEENIYYYIVDSIPRVQDIVNDPLKDVTRDENLSSTTESFLSPPIIGTPLYKLIEQLLIEKTTDESMKSFEYLASILQTDFNIDLSGMNEATIESYMVVLKWSLKGWPGWEEMTDEEKTPPRDITKEYDSIKKYISLRLRITRHCVAAVEKKMPESVENGKLQLRKNEQLSLNVRCSPAQLKSLINSKISHVHRLINFTPSTVDKHSRYRWKSFRDVFSWPWLDVHVELPAFSFTHRNISSSVYRLVNYMGSHPVSKDRLDGSVGVKNNTDKKIGLQIDFVMDYLDQMANFLNNSHGGRNNSAKSCDLPCLFREISKDVSMLEDHIMIGVDYKYNLSNFSYEQMLSNAIDTTTLINDDLYKKYEHVQPRLQHTITPSICFTLNKFRCTYTIEPEGMRIFSMGLESLDEKTTWFKISCSLCNFSVTGLESFTKLNNHINTKHGTGHYWQCVNCNKYFHVLELAYYRWRHTCG